MSIIVYSSIDELLIPAAIYTETLAHNTSAIVAYFEANPQLIFQFVGFNGTLKRANQLDYERKCGCFYTIPWDSQYEVVNSVTANLILNFTQQVEMYRFMIQNYNPDPATGFSASYMRYLSAIALGIALKLKQTKSYIDNNQCWCGSPLTTVSFANNYAYLLWLRQNNIPV